MIIRGVNLTLHPMSVSKEVDSRKLYMIKKQLPQLQNSTHKDLHACKFEWVLMGKQACDCEYCVKVLDVLNVHSLWLKCTSNVTSTGMVIRVTEKHVKLK